MLRCIRLGATVLAAAAFAIGTMRPGGTLAQTHRIVEYTGWWYAAEGARPVPVHLYLRVNLLNGRVEVMQPSYDRQRTEVVQLRPVSPASSTSYAFDFDNEDQYEPKYRYTCTLNLGDVNRVSCEDHQAPKPRSHYWLLRCVCSSCARPCQ